jgi:hypothetical protein
MRWIYRRIARFEPDRMSAEPRTGAASSALNSEAYWGLLCISLVRSGISIVPMRSLEASRTPMRKIVSPAGTKIA